MPLISAAVKQQDELKHMTTDITNCGDLTFPKDIIISNMDILNYYVNYFSHVKVYQKEAVNLEINTRQQNLCPLWQQERCKRITASNFGRVMLCYVRPNHTKIYKFLK
jgi:hypothetical protein